MSTLQVTNIKKTGETASRDVSGVAAAWVNLNGTGTIAIQDSANVSSLTDIAVGKYQVDYISAMTNSSNSVVAGVSTDNAGSYNSPIVVNTLAASTTVESRPDLSSSTGDSSVVTAQTMGDLA